MPSYNRVIIVGNLTHDPEFKTFASGSGVAEFNVAINRSYLTRDGEKREEVTFVGVKAFGKPGEVISKYFRKGKPILVEGRLSQDNWEDGQGNKRSKTYVSLDKFEFIDGPRDQDEAPHREPAQSKPPSNQDDFTDTLDEDVPF